MVIKMSMIRNINNILYTQFGKLCVKKDDLFQINITVMDSISFCNSILYFGENIGDIDYDGSVDYKYYYIISKNGRIE